MDKLRDHEDVEPYSEADAEAEWDEWQKQAIMDDKAQQEGTVKFEFDIEPVEQARPRATRMRKGIRVYDPKKVAVFKRQLGMLAKQQMLDRGLERCCLSGTRTKYRSKKFLKHLVNNRFQAICVAKRNGAYLSNERYMAVDHHNFNGRISDRSVF